MTRKLSMLGLTIGLAVIGLALFVSLIAMADTPVGTAFTYQGYLEDGGSAANGDYDFKFELYDAASGGNQVGSTLTMTPTTVSDGLFTVELDFGSDAFTGDARWLEISVRQGAEAYSVIDPRTALTLAPYALQAVDAWSITGNVSTTYGTNFLGTTDNMSLTLRVNNQGALRLEPHATSPNVIGGYSGNSVTAGKYGATIGGGGASGYANSVTANYATVGGGYGNEASGYGATVGGGETDTASGEDATVGGGWQNTANGGHATVGGGQSNTASNMFATVGGGYQNTANGSWATVPGGRSNEATGDYSFAAGRQAKANNAGCFVWGDSTASDVTCSNDNRTIFRSSGGFYIYTNIGLTSGMYLAASGSAWNAVSDRERKENFAPVDTQELLARLAENPITTWNYKSQDPSIRHIGPMAQDFNTLIEGLGGEGEKYINTLDADGVALAAVQGLYQLSQEQAARIEELEAENAALQGWLGDLEARLAALEATASSK